MTERCSTSTSLILSGGSSSTTGQRDAASLSSRFGFWFGVKIPSTFILVSTDFELSAISKIVKVFLTGTSLQPSWRPHQTKQALVDWANIFGDNNVDCLQSNLVQMQMCTNFPVQQPLFAFSGCGLCLIGRPSHLVFSVTLAVETPSRHIHFKMHQAHALLCNNNRRQVKSIGTLMLGGWGTSKVKWWWVEHLS